MRVALLRDPLDLRSSGIGQTEHFPNFVESLAGRVVDGGAQSLIVADAANGDDLRVAAETIKADMETRFHRSAAP